MQYLREVEQIKDRIQGKKTGHLELVVTAEMDGGGLEKEEEHGICNTTAYPDVRVEKKDKI